MRRLLPLMLSLAATAAVAPTAHAAPDWTLGEPLVSADGRDRSFAAVGYDAAGTRTTAFLDADLAVPRSELLVTSQRPGEPQREELRVPTSAGLLPTDPRLAVAPSGAAVLAWAQTTTTNHFRTVVSYRPAGGAWEAPKVVSPTTSTHTGDPFRGAKVAIGADGTAAVIAAAEEPNGAGEFQTDTRLDVAVHPPGGAWTTPERIGTPDVSADFPEIGLDDHGGLTVVYHEVYAEGAFSSSLDDLRVAVVRRRSASTGLFSSPERLAPDVEKAVDRGVQLAVNADGRAVAVWQRELSANQPRSVVAAVRSSANGKWGAPEALPVPADSGVLGAAVAPDGAAYALLQDGNAHEVIAARKPVAGSWSAGTRVSSTGLTHIVGAITTSGNDAFMGWGGDLGGGTVVQGARWSAGAAAPDTFTDLGAGDVDAIATESDHHGGAAVVWQDDLRTFAGGFDASAPLPIGADVPRSATAGSPVAMKATFADLWSPLSGETTWDFGDGTTASGTTVSHVYASAGGRTVTARSRDALGLERAQAFAVDVSAAGTPPAPAPAPASAPSPRAAADVLAPKVTLALPACKRGTSKKACAKLRRSRKAWQMLRGTVGDAAPSAGIARVEVTATSGRKRIVRRAVVKAGAWSVRLPKLTRGRWTFMVRAVDGAAHAAKPATRGVRLG